MHAWTSTWLSLVSMLLYTVSNASLRHLGELQAPIAWCLAIKETVAVALLAPWVLYRLVQGRYRFQSIRLFWLLVAASLICQAVGSHNHLLAYALVGLVIAVPALQSSQLIATALIGKYVLNDSISRAQCCAMGLLLIAVLLLSLGKSTDSAASLPGGGSALRTLQGVAAAMVAALAYAVYFNILRYLLRQHRSSSLGVWETLKIHDWTGHDLATEPGTPERRYSPVPVTLLMIVVTGVGVMYYGGLILATQGFAGFTDVPQECWFWVLLSGLTNLTGFFFQVQALLLASAAKMSLIAAFQIVIFAILGILFFGEPMNLLIALGVVLAIVGVFFTK